MKRPKPRQHSVVDQTIAKQLFQLRVGIIDDPKIRRSITQDGELDPPLDPMKVKSSEENIDMVNTVTGLIAIRWIDGGPGGGLALPSEPNGETSSLISKAVEIVPTLSTGIWGGKHPVTGQFTVCGIEFMPPAGSYVLVGFIRNSKPIVLGYWLPQYTSVFNQEESRYQTLEPGEVRISSFGGSYIQLTNTRDNSVREQKQQTADIIISHVKGSKISLTSKPQDEFGELAILHGSGSGIVFDEYGGIQFKQKENPEANIPGEPNTQAGLSFNGKESSVSLKSVSDLNLVGGTYTNLSGNAIYLNSEREFSIRANENSTMTFAKGLNITANEDLILNSDKRAFMNFKGGLQLELSNKSVIEAKADLIISSNANVQINAGVGTLTLTGVTPPGIGPSVAGVVTANTFCPITGPHIGAIGNSVKCSTLAPIIPNAPGM